MHEPADNLTYKEVIDILKHVKQYQPLKTSTWSPSEVIRPLWFSHSEGLVKTTDDGYVLTEKGEMLLK